jgi:signal transduction histidine kinase
VVVDENGQLVADSQGMEPIGTPYRTPERPEFDTVFSKPGGEIFADTRASATLKQDLLIVAVPVVHFREAIGAVRASVSLDAVHSKVRITWLGYAIVGLVAILVGLAATWVLAGTLVRPVRRLEDAAVRLGGGDLNARADPSGPQEIATLGTAFNQMASTLSANLSAQKDFVANASHQLRTPLTGLRLRLEAIKEDGGFAAEQAAKAELEVDRLAGLVEDLLVLARASSMESTGVTVDLADAAREAVDRWAETAARSDKVVQVDRCEPATVWAELSDVNQILDNLIENAIRYTPEGTEVSLRTGTMNGHAFLEVADTGPGIPPEERDRIFDRFYRGSAGRRGGAGTGLGLAIVHELANRWGGRILLSEGPGARFEVRFGRPRPAESARTPNEWVPPTVS